MHRPLRDPLHLRVWNLIKGILFYNTVYWEKASDGLNLPTLTREERERNRPKPDPEIVRPREKPRARKDASYLAQISDPDPESLAGEHFVSETTSVPPGHQGREATAAEGSEQTSTPEGHHVRRRRKYKRRRTSSANGGDSFWRRVFGRD